MKTDPTLSVIVTIVNGGIYVRDILAAMAKFENPPPLDIIVPYDESVDDVAQYASEFPDVTFLPMGAISPAHPISTQAGQHELFDRRRAAGLAIARGDLIAILEDRGFPQPDWARNAVRLHAEKSNKVIGGAVECHQPAGSLNWAFYVCEFGRYGVPVTEGPVEWVTDINVTYKRAAIDETQHLWKERYQEPVVHWALIETGEKLILSNDLVVEHRRDKLSFKVLMPERFDWGRLFGHIRAANVSVLERLKLIVAGPLIPFVLLLRHGKRQAQNGQLARYIRVSPLVFVLLCGWTAGEVWGYITKRS